MKTTTSITARYAETDQMGVVHHAVYPIWFEVARTHHIKQMGMSYPEMEAQGILLPVSALHCNYRRPVYYENEVSIQTSISKLTPARIEFTYEIMLPQQIVACCGHTIHAWTSRTLRPFSLKKQFPDIFALMQQGIGRNDSKTQEG